MSKNRLKQLQTMVEHEEQALDEALEESFPASDPPAQTDPSRGIIWSTARDSEGTEELLILKAHNLSKEGAVHGFFGRKGGISAGHFASLNCATDTNDQIGAVAENRARALAELWDSSDRLIPSLVTLCGRDNADIIVVTTPWTLAECPHGSGMATAEAGIALGLLTADEAPVLMADTSAHIIGAAQASASLAYAGVTDNLIAAMEGLGAQRAHIRAAIGPCISQAALEVGPEFEVRFQNAPADYRRFLGTSKRTGFWHFALREYVACRLERAGIGDVEVLPACTYGRESDFFSLQRAAGRKKWVSGRQLSTIMQ